MQSSLLATQTKSSKNFDTNKTSFELLFDVLYLVPKPRGLMLFVKEKVSESGNMHS